MAAIDGLELTVAGGDAVVADGMLDGVALEGATLDAAGLDAGNALVVVQGGDTLAIVNEADYASDEVAIGSATVDGAGAVTAVSYAGRGSSPAVAH